MNSQILKIFRKHNIVIILWNCYHLKINWQNPIKLSDNDSIEFEGEITYAKLLTALKFISETWGCLNFRTIYKKKVDLTFENGAEYCILEIGYFSDVIVFTKTM